LHSKDFQEEITSIWKEIKEGINKNSNLDDLSRVTLQSSYAKAHENLLEE
jgi:hypothetical protein